jgi:hypothetical protein
VTSSTGSAGAVSSSEPPRAGSRAGPGPRVRGASSLTVPLGVGGHLSAPLPADLGLEAAVLCGRTLPDCVDSRPDLSFFSFSILPFFFDFFLNVGEVSN